MYQDMMSAIDRPEAMLMMPEVHATVAALKAGYTWNYTDAIDMCR
jgi:hypothetical protein